ncbi:hypothetical protein QR680_011596 [Steinernema hermaphroditum]|uniref:Uncharacterized protein n=1 Tax=Steinernema hermaphroditum TaxID=289476 RepID=A0AA39I1H4_9BILA|nr:hypothetical protein QR680_011596 [Steinernema hermaphroditum]
MPTHCATERNYAAHSLVSSSSATTFASCEEPSLLIPSRPCFSQILHKTEPVCPAQHISEDPGEEARRLDREEVTSATAVATEVSESIRIPANTPEDSARISGPSGSEEASFATPFATDSGEPLRIPANTPKDPTRTFGPPGSEETTTTTSVAEIINKPFHTQAHTLALT